jgi:hypothetical protein
MECCIMGEWTASVRTAALRRPDSGADTAFVVEPRSAVTTLKSYVHIKAPGVVVFRRAHTFTVRHSDSHGSAAETMTRVPGDTIYNVALMGEATDAWFWYRGHNYHTSGGDLDFFSVMKADATHPFDVLSEPSAEWWVEARAKNGTVGWLFAPYTFNEAGRCR